MKISNGVVLSKALFTRKGGNPGARVTLTRGLPSTRTFLLFLHDMSTRKVGLPWHKGNLPECLGYPTCLENILLGITHLPRQGSI